VLKFYKNTSMHNNRIIYEIFIFLALFRDMIYIFLKDTFRSRSIVLLVMSIEPNL